MHCLTLLCLSEGWKNISLLFVRYFDKATNKGRWGPRGIEQQKIWKRKFVSYIFSCNFLYIWYIFFFSLANLIHCFIQFPWMDSRGADVHVQISFSSNGFFSWILTSPRSVWAAVNYIHIHSLKLPTLLSTIWRRHKRGTG